jgi:putative spermidine/putrescine transport system substrate-binding protein
VRNRNGKRWWLALAALTLAMAALTAAGCGGDDDDNGGGGGGSEAPTKLGKGEGEVDLIAWAGYVEDGSTDPKVDWVSDFEKKTGCQVNVKVGNTSDEMVTLMRTGKYDGVSASGDATLRLIAGGDVAPVNTDLVPNYKDVFDALKNQPHNTVDGVNYGIPHGRGANLLMFNTDAVKPAPDSWGAVLDPAQSSKYKGKVTAYDNPIYIADAALYLKATQPDLGIDNVYELDDKQFNAAVDLLKQQRPNIGEYWSDYTKEQAAFTAGDTVIGTTWQVIANLIEADKKSPPIKAILPKEGATGWSDTWMISSKAEHPNCMYRWMDHIISPQANAEVAEWFGEAPANRKSCALTAVKDHCQIFHADDEAYFDRVAYWNTPRKECGDDRGAVCMDYSEWVKAWTEIKG